MGKQRWLKLSNQVRREIRDSGLTRYRISQETGIDQSTLSKFFNGQCGLSMDVLDRLGEYLELEITTRRKARQRKGQ